MDTKRLTVDIPTELHQELRLMAIKHNCTMTQYVTRTLIRQLIEERKYESSGAEDSVA